MRLLIDEMYPPVIAERLRIAGHDAVSVAEDPDLAGQDDSTVCDVAVASRRAVVTENTSDYLAILTQRGAAGQVAPSLLITSNRTYPRHPRSFIGRAIRALASFCDEHPEDDPQAGAVYSLRPFLQ